ncbi:Clavaminate synthase-like protein [Biscogniauxia mediterranea]|nr:Clavaminate synthase-like protein [Biscogniauxia mediterranea]
MLTMKSAVKALAQVPVQRRLLAPVLSPIHHIAAAGAVPQGPRFYTSSSEASTTGASPADTPLPADKSKEGESKKTKRPPFKIKKITSIFVFKDINAWTVELPGSIEHPSTLRINHPELAEPVWISRSWLRDACTCPACVEPSSGQKRFSTADVPLQPAIESVAHADDGSLEVSWADDFHTHDTHLSRYPPSLCEKLITPPHNKKSVPRVLWDKAAMEERKPYIDYVSFMEDPASFQSGLHLLHSHGLFILRGVPSSEDMVEKIATKIGTIQNSLYGMTWDVVSKPNAENIAYTDSYLPLHQDLLYMSNVPRIQLLHCIKNSCDGGESRFRDGKRVFWQMREKMSRRNTTLFRRMVSFEYTKNGHLYQYNRHLISKKQNTIIWSPQFQSPMQLVPRVRGPTDNFHERWHRSVKMLQELIETETEIYEYKLNEGDCVIFDNIRILHGRRKFDTSSGERWLRGAYVDNDSFTSTMRALGYELPGKYTDGTDGADGTEAIDAF